MPSPGPRHKSEAHGLALGTGHSEGQGEEHPAEGRVGLLRSSSGTLWGRVGPGRERAARRTGLGGQEEATVPRPPQGPLPWPLS